MDVLSVYAVHDVMDANENTEIADIAAGTEIATGMEMMPVMDKLVIKSSPERDMEVQLYA